MQRRAVDRLQQRLAHALVLEDADAGAILGVELNVGVRHGALDRDRRFGLARSDGIDIGLESVHDVESAGQQLGDLRLLVGNRRQHDALDAPGRRTSPMRVGVVALVDHLALGGIERDDPIGTGADRLAAEIALVLERAIDVLRIDRNVRGQAVEERREHLLAGDPHGEPSIFSTLSIQPKRLSLKRKLYFGSMKTSNE